MSPQVLPAHARRIVIAGGPGCGKTTLATKLSSDLGFRLRHTDELVGKLDWSESSAEVARWLDEPGPWLLEGTTMVRAIRKWLAAGHPGKPCDAVLMMVAPRVQRSVRQIGMAKSVMTVWKQIVPALIERKVTLLYGR